jgi:hypothetical protein
MHLLTCLVVFLSYFRQTLGGFFERRGGIEIDVGFWLDNLKERDSTEGIGLGGDNNKTVHKEIS